MVWSWVPWWHWVAMALIWLVVLGTIVWAARSTFPPARDARGDTRAVLDARLARGDVDLEQYRRLREELDRV